MKTLAWAPCNSVQSLPLRTQIDPQPDDGAQKMAICIGLDSKSGMDRRFEVGIYLAFCPRLLKREDNRSRNESPDGSVRAVRAMEEWVFLSVVRF